MYRTLLANLVRGDRNHKQDVFVRDRRRGTTTRASVTSHERGASDNSFEPDLVAFQLSRTDLIEQGDGPVGRVLIRKRTARATWIPETSRSGFPALSGDGRIVAFTSAANRRAEILTDGPLR